jgi:acetylornithine deacetylase/succinyl-diaminopimelate desuccinylase-like protein
VSPTIIKGGFQANVIPSEAEATLDIRMTPGADAGKFFEAMAKIIDDPSVKIVPSTAKRPAGPPCGLNTDMFRALEAVSNRMYPDAATLPMMMTGATDMAELRAKGMQCYGIGPESTDEEFAAHGWHSDVERATAPSIYKLASSRGTRLWKLRRRNRSTSTPARALPISGLNAPRGRAVARRRAVPVAREEIVPV